MKKNLSRNQIIIIFCILAILAGAVFSYLQFSTLSTLREEIEEEQLAVDIARAELSRLINHRNNEEDYRLRIDFVKSKIPSSPEEQELLSYLYYLADLYTLESLDIRFEGRSEESGYMRMPLNLSFEASYEATQLLLGRFYSGDRAIRVDSLRLVKATGSALRVSVSANAFYSDSIK